MNSTYSNMKTCRKGNLVFFPILLVFLALALQPSEVQGGRFLSRACDFLGRIDWFEATGPEDECIERDEGTEAAVTEETPEVVDTRDVEGTDGESELLTEDERKKKSESLIAQATAGAICSTLGGDVGSEHCICYRSKLSFGSFFGRRRNNNRKFKVKCGVCQLQFVGEEAGGTQSEAASLKKEKEEKKFD